MGGHGGLNILPQKRWNVYNFDNREKVRQDEEAAAKEEQLKREQSRKRDAEFRLQKLRLARGIHSSDQSTTTTTLASSSTSTDSNHINLFEGLKNFHSLETKPQQEQEADQTEDKGFKKKKLKKEEAPKVVTAEDEKYRLGYGIAGKGVKAPWYMSKPSLSTYNNDDEKEGSTNRSSEKKKSGKKTVEELREERLKREKREKERELALVRDKSRPRNVTSFQMVATRGTKGNPATSKATKTTSSKTSKGKSKATEGAPQTLEERMAEAPDWAKALIEAVEEQVNALGEFMEEVDGCVGDLNRRMEILTNNGGSHTDTPTGGAATNGGVVIVDGNTPRVEPQVQAPLPSNDAWMRTVERFNKIKPKAFAGKSDATEAARWLDSMSKIFSLLGVSSLEQQKLASFNLEDSAWEWWMSASTNAERNVMLWEEFEWRFKLMFIPESSKNVKEKELLELKQGAMTVDEYEQQFRTLCHFAVNLDTSNEERKCRMFENGIRDEIRLPVVTSLHDHYNKCVESARAAERSAPKPKAKKVAVEAKAKVTSSGDVSNASKPWMRKNSYGNNHSFGKRPWGNGGNGGSEKSNGNFGKFQKWKKPRNGDGEQAKGGYGSYQCACFKCGLKGHKAAECTNLEVRKQAKGNGGQGQNRFNQQGGGQAYQMLGPQMYAMQLMEQGVAALPTPPVQQALRLLLPQESMW